MITFLCFDEIFTIMPFIMPLLFFVIVGVIIAVIVAKRVQASKSQQRLDEYNAQHQYYTDGNGRTEHQRDYLNEKRRQLADRKVSAKDGSHSHSGRAEKYDKIVGSLGEVNDEGCAELDGVRLIAHDESYCDDPAHIVEANRDDLVRAMVLGEVINTPRFKQMYTKKK